MCKRKLVVWCWGVLWAARRGDWTDRWPTAPALVSAGPHPPPGCSKWALDVLEQKTHEQIKQWYFPKISLGARSKLGGRPVDIQATHTRTRRHSTMVISQALSLRPALLYGQRVCVQTFCRSLQCDVKMNFDCHLTGQSGDSSKFIFQTYDPTMSVEKPPEANVHPK